MMMPDCGRIFAIVQRLCCCAAVALACANSIAADAAQSAWTVGCRDAMLKPTGAADCWAALKAVGAEGVEVAVVDDLSLPLLYNPAVKYTLATPEGIQKLADDAKTAGIRITAFCLSNKFGNRPDFEVEFCGKVARAAKQLGVPAVRIDVAMHKGSPDEQEAFLKIAVGAIRKIIADTESTGVKFGVENHGYVTNDPAFTDALFAGVGSDRLCLTLDTANLYWFGHPLSKVYEIYAHFAPKVCHTHCKSIKYPADQREQQRQHGWKYAEDQSPVNGGDIDFSRVASILQKAGYGGDLCIEDEFLGKLSPADATKRLAGQVEYLKQIRAKISEK
jgi:sugar phosphate isomerase/epimerase